MRCRLSFRYLIMALAPVTLLSACQGDGSSPAPSNSASSTGATTGPLPDVAGGSTPAALWSRYFVTSYDMAKVLAQRASAAFTNSTVHYSFGANTNGNPAYDGNVVVTSNALLDAHLDYALSTGLTGAGVTLGMIDSEVMTGHIQFAGKSVSAAGATGTPDFHGTAVASVMVGNGSDGQMTGFAPGASLYAGTIDYSTTLDWSAIAGYVLGAKAAGAVAINNSWGYTTPGGIDATVANTNLRAEFSSGAEAGYLSALRSYTQSGVVVFAAQNNYNATSISAVAGLPSAFPDLKPSWIAVINAIPTLSGDQIVGANRISAPCAEAATYCLAANGQTRVADSAGAASYTVGGGASFAAPQVTGALGLLAQAFPDLTPQQLRDRLLVTADNGFFTPTGTVTFAPGIVHGYNAEFGMGFLDLKAALLPIGTTSIPTASGGRVSASQSVIATGSASGNAVASALSSSQIVVLDQMGGNFTAPATAFAATASGSDRSALRLSVLGSPSAGVEAARYADALRSGAADRMLDHADLMAMPDAARLFAGSSDRKITLNGTRLALTQDAGRLTGVAVTQDLPAGTGAFRLGLSGFVESGGVLGVTAPGYSDAVQSVSGAVRIGYAAPIAPGMSLRAQGEFGLARGSAAGLISSIGTLGYNRLGLSLDQADVAAAGDVLTLFARTPVTISSGSATLTLPVSYSIAGPGFAATQIPLSPKAQEVNLGMEYSRPIGDRVLLRGGLSYAVNAGNISGARSLDAALGLSVWF